MSARHRTAGCSRATTSRALEGYHSPQVDVDGSAQHQREPVRAAGRSSSTRCVAALRDVDWNRYPDRGATESARRARRVPRSAERAAAVRQRQQRDPADAAAHLRRRGPARADVRADLRAARADRARHRHRGRRRASAAPTTAIDPDAAVATHRRGTRPSVVFVCSPNNPTGTVEPRETVERLLAAAAEVGALLVVDEAYGEFAPWSALELVADDRPLVVVRTYSKVWSLAGGAARLRGRADVGDRRAREGAAAVQPLGADAARRHGRARLPRARWSSGSRRSSRSGAGCSPRSPTLPGLDGRARRAPTSCCSASTATRTSCGSACSTHGVLVRDFSSWPRIEGCLRVTVGTPEENDAFLAALGEALPEVVT